MDSLIHSIFGQLFIKYLQGWARCQLRSIGGQYWGEHLNNKIVYHDTRRNSPCFEKTLSGLIYCMQGFVRSSDTSRKYMALCSEGAQNLVRRSVRVFAQKTWGHKRAPLPVWGSGVTGKSPRVRNTNVHVRDRRSRIWFWITSAELYLQPRDVFDLIPSLMLLVLWQFKVQMAKSPLWRIPFSCSHVFAWSSIKMVSTRGSMADGAPDAGITAMVPIFPRSHPTSCSSCVLQYL